MHRVPFGITLLLVSICASEQSRLHEALVDVSFLFGEVQVSSVHDMAPSIINLQTCYYCLLCFFYTQLILSLAVLTVCFLITTVCTLAIVLITRARSRHSRKEAASSCRSSPLIETKPVSACHDPPFDHQPPLKSRRQATAKDSGNYAEKCVINSTGRLLDPSWYDPSSSVGFINSEKNKTSAKREDSSDENISEKSSLLPQEHEISPEPATLGFGEMSESAGIWYRDTSGKHLTRFVVLHMFLIISMLMVGG